MLGKVQIPEHIQKVFIGADKDRSGAGQVAAGKLAQRLWGETGRTARIVRPPMSIPDDESGVDWLDYINQGQEVAHV